MANHPSLDSARRSLDTLNDAFNENHRIIGKITPEGREYRVIPASETLPEGWDEAKGLSREEEQIIEDVDAMIDELFNGAVF
jgi:hypothetical protein